MIGVNLFHDFHYDLWAPEDLRELSFESALSKLEIEPSLEAAFVVFWTIFETPDPDGYVGVSKSSLSESESEIPNEASRNQHLENEQEEVGSSNREDLETIAMILSELVLKLKPDYSPDLKIGDVEAWIFATVSSAAAVQLKRHDAGRSERFWELIGNSIALLSRPNIHPWCEEVEPGISQDLVTSNYLVKIWLLANQFERHAAFGEDEDALSCLYEASRICRSVDFELADESEFAIDVESWMQLQAGNVLTLSPEGEVVDNQPPGPAMRVMKAGYHLIESIVTPQQAADTFQRLYHKNPSESTDWPKISSRCEVISAIWTRSRSRTRIKSEFSAFPQSSQAFWLTAKGLALHKINPGDLVKALNTWNESESETRLRIYFFGDMWLDIPEPSRQALIAADNEFMAAEGRRVGIFNNLRLAVEPIIDEKLVTPFKKWLESHSKEFVSAGGSLSLRLSRQIVELSELNNQDFAIFAESHIPNMNGAKWNNLFDDLKALRDIRGDADHPEQDNVPQSEKIIFQYKKFLGINRRSVIRLLMECNYTEPM